MSPVPFELDATIALALNGDVFAIKQIQKFAENGFDSREQRRKLWTLLLSFRLREKKMKDGYSAWLTYLVKGLEGNSGAFCARDCLSREELKLGKENKERFNSIIEKDVARSLVHFDINQNTSEEER
jgi:hypothetical protein